MDIAQGNLGTVGKYEVDLENSAIKASVDVNVPFGTAGIQITLKGEFLLDALAKLIPGTFDDALIAVAKSALATVSAKAPTA
jgi:hypothetical protein